MIELLLPTKDKIGIGHLFKKREFFPKLYQNDFKGMLVVNANPDVKGSNENWEANYLYIYSERKIISPTQGKYYVAHCVNPSLNRKPFKYISNENIGLIKVDVDGEIITTTYSIFETSYEIKFTTDLKLINDGVEKVDDMWLESYVREQNELNYKPQEPVSNELIQFMRPYFLQLVFDVQDTLSKPDNAGFDLDKWIKDNIRQ